MLTYPNTDYREVTSMAMMVTLPYINYATTAATIGVPLSRLCTEEQLKRRYRMLAGRDALGITREIGRLRAAC